MHEVCNYRRQSDESCLSSCCASPQCEGTSSKSHYSKDPCVQCTRLAQESKRVQKQATKAADNYDQEVSAGRGSYADPLLGEALVGLPGSAFCSYSKRQQQRAPLNHRQDYDHDGPTTYSGGNARPLKDLPSMPAQGAEYRSQQPMCAEPQRRPGPDLTKTQQLANIHRPQYRHAPPTQLAQAAQVVIAPQNLTRRDSNGVSELGSDNGESSAGRSHELSPRAISPLQQNHRSYQPWS
jgi:hypothetical protein